MTETTERPLVTFAVIAYNQERFIREAIEGAFAQTYQPLEIILSDDCSPDRTYEIMQEMAAAYDGPHKVVLNRNEPNLGLVGHVNRIFFLAKSQLIIANAGDDISTPARTQIIFESWNKTQYKPYLIHSSAVEINHAGDEIRVRAPRDYITKNTKLELIELIKNQINGIGATFAWDQRIHGFFGDLPDYAEIEDRPLFFRAAALGKVSYIDEPLVKYRTGGMSSPSNEAIDNFILFGGRIRMLSWKVTSTMSILKDIKLLDFTDKEKCVAFSKKLVDLGKLEIQISKSRKVEILFMIPHVFILSIKHKSLKPIRFFIKYMFSSLYLNYKKFRIDTLD